jgi:hypothetical protein
LPRLLEIVKHICAAPRIECNYLNIGTSMSSPAELKAVVLCPTPGELYKSRPPTEPGAARLYFAALDEVFRKLRITRLEEVPVGGGNARAELTGLLTAMLTRLKRGETAASMRLTFEMTTDPGPHKRTVIVDIALALARVTVIGVQPVAGTSGFLREKGWYARAREQRRRVDGKVDHYLTGGFAQAREGELLAVIDNTRIKGEPGINVRGNVIAPKRAAKYWLETGAGIAKKEDARGRIELYATGIGMVKSRYDAEGNLRHLTVERSLKLGEVGLRAGGHVVARGAGGRGEALQVETAEFRTISAAFEARTEGAIFVRETVQGKVHGASVTADLVNQMAGKFIVATRGALTINRSVQGGYLYGPEVVIGNGRVPATLMNGVIHARNLFIGRNLILAGRNRIVLGNDTFHEPAAEGTRSRSSGSNLFANRPQLQLDLAERRSELTRIAEALGAMISGHIRRKMVARQVVNREAFSRSLEVITLLDQQLAAAPAGQEDALLQRFSGVLFDIGVEDTLPFLQRFSRKKKLKDELVQLEAALAAITQNIVVELDLGAGKEGAVLTVKCWKDEVLCRCLDQELRIERPATEELLFSGPAKRRTVSISFDYASERLACEVTA